MTWAKRVCALGGRKTRAQEYSVHKETAVDGQATLTYFDFATQEAVVVLIEGVMCDGQGFSFLYLWFWPIVVCCCVTSDALLFTAS
jgi:hypothetical protein